MDVSSGPVFLSKIGGLVEDVISGLIPLRTPKKKNEKKRSANLVDLSSRTDSSDSGHICHLSEAQFLLL